MSFFKNFKLILLLLFLLLFLIYCYLYQVVLKVDSTLRFKNASGMAKKSQPSFVQIGVNWSYSVAETSKPNAEQILLHERLPYRNSFVIPPETYDRKSPFYGMVYQNLYGLPLSALSNKTFKEKIIDWWGNYFPVLLLAIENDQNQNPYQNESFFTKSGVVHLHKTNFTLHENFVATITSLDTTGRNRSWGGDHYRARIVRDNDNSTYPDGIPCKVHDNNNGTYTVEAPLPLEGLLQLQVKLVNTLPRIRRIINLTTTNCITHNHFWMTLESNEVVLCAVSSEW